MDKLSEFVIEKTREWFRENGRETAVIGISGGKDSAVVAAICKEALGAENVFGVLMPDGIQKDINDSMQVVNELDIPYTIIDIGPACNAIRSSLETPHPSEDMDFKLTTEAAINIPPRVRMTYLYAVAQSLNRKAVVVGTSNAAEIYVGYSTKWGDSASDFNPIGNLWVHQVLQIGDELGYFPNIIHKAPADGLCGSTDEERLGFRYDEVYLYATHEHVEAEAAEKIRQRHEMSRHKWKPIPKISI